MCRRLNYLRPGHLIWRSRGIILSFKFKLCFSSNLIELSFSNHFRAHDPTPTKGLLLVPPTSTPFCELAEHHPLWRPHVLPMFMDISHPCFSHSTNSSSFSSSSSRKYIDPNSETSKAPRTHSKTYHIGPKPLSRFAGLASFLSKQVWLYPPRPAPTIFYLKRSADASGPIKVSSNASEKESLVSNCIAASISSYHRELERLISAEMNFGLSRIYTVSVSFMYLDMYP